MTIFKSFVCLFQGRVSIHLRLTVSERREIESLLSLNPSDSKLSRNSKIIKRIDDGKSFTTVADELCICRQTVSKVYHRYVIFGIDGIMCDAIRLGRKPTISRERANEVLCTPLYQTPPNKNRWTVQDLADVCDLPFSTTYRLIKSKGISLDNPKSVRNAFSISTVEPISILGFFTAPLVLVIIFSCKAQIPQPSLKYHFGTTVLNHDNVHAFFSRKSAQFQWIISEISEELLLINPRASNQSDFLLFLNLIDKSVEDEMLIIANNLEMVFNNRIAASMEKESRFHLIDSLGIDQWLGWLRIHLNSVSERNKKRIAFQLEHLVMNIREWREGPFRNENVFASVYPLR